LTKVKDMYSWWFEDPLDMIQQWEGRANRLAARCRVTIRGINLNDVDSEMARVERVYNDAWRRNWGFVRLTHAELRHFAKSLADFAIPEMLLLAEVDGSPVGISLTLPDLNEALRPLDGRLVRWGLPLGYLKLRVGVKQIKACRLFTLGVAERYRRRGVLELLVLRTLQYGKNVLGYTGAELGWTLEDNHSINRAIEAVGGLHYKTYRIYEKPLA
jgi:GNAT superfamily N-acetyltransferase